MENLLIFHTIKARFACIFQASLNVVPIFNIGLVVFAVVVICLCLRQIKKMNKKAASLSMN